ncbi:hypothetical protein TNCV_3111711 [Trichonephila clavipes]|nr:hypothetical protein TNCV_3111711 [Trichonephila clavipes]
MAFHQNTLVSEPYGGHGSPVIRVMDSWLACHDFEPSTAEDPPCRGCRCMLNMSRLKYSPIGVVWKRWRRTLDGESLRRALDREDLKVLKNGRKEDERRWRWRIGVI